MASWWPNRDTEGWKVHNMYTRLRHDAKDKADAAAGGTKSPSDETKGPDGAPERHPTPVKTEAATTVNGTLVKKEE